MKDTMKEKKNLIIKIAVAVICVAFLVGLVVVQYIYRSFSTYRTVKEVEVGGVSERQTIKMGDHLVVYNKDGMRCMDAKGKAVWDVTYQMQEPCVVADGDLIAVGGYGDSKIYIMNDMGKVGEINTNFPIRNMCIAEAGYVAAVLDDKDVYWIYLYDTDGEEMAKARVTMKQHGYPLSISLSSNGKLLGVSYIYLDAGVMESRVAFYNFGEVGQNYTDQFMSSFIYKEIVPELHYMNSNVVMGISNDRLMVYSGSEKPAVLKEVLLNEEVQGVYWGDENVVLVYKGTSEQGKHFIQVYDMTGTLVLEKGFDLEYTGITSQNGIITIYNSNEILVCTLDGRERYSGKWDFNIKSIVSTSVKYKYLVLCEDTYKVIELE